MSSIPGIATLFDMPYYNPYIENLQAPFVSLHSLICQHTWIASPASVSTAFLPAHARIPVHALRLGSLTFAGTCTSARLTLICRRIRSVLAHSHLPAHAFSPGLSVRSAAFSSRFHSMQKAPGTFLRRPKETYKSNCSPGNSANQRNRDCR